MRVFLGPCIFICRKLYALKEPGKDQHQQHNVDGLFYMVSQSLLEEGGGQFWWHNYGTIMTRKRKGVECYAANHSDQGFKKHKRNL
jgi:hypothetical protein